MSESSVVAIITTALMALVSVVASVLEAIKARYQARKDVEAQLRQERISAYSNLLALSNKCLMLDPRTSPSIDLVAEFTTASYRAICVSSDAMHTAIENHQMCIVDALGPKRSEETIKAGHLATMELAERAAAELSAYGEWTIKKLHKASR